MAYQEQFTCDVCGTVRQPSNNWFIGQGLAETSLSLVLSPFNAELAKSQDSFYGKISTLCGQSCASMWVSQNLESLHSKPAAP